MRPDIGIRTADNGTALCDQLQVRRNRLNHDPTEGCATCGDAAHP